MPPNVFLTGPMRCGKSTLLSKVIAESGLPAGGYFVQRLMMGSQTRAFHLVDVSCEPYVPDLEVRTIDNYTNIIGYINGKMIWHPEVLDEKGTSIIRQALFDRKSVVLMDEIGRIELKAPGFQQAIFEALDSKQMVIGVIKPEKNNFLDTIRGREDVLILDLSQMTHKAALLELRCLIKTVHRETPEENCMDSC